MDYLIHFISRILGWLLDLVVWIGEYIWQTILEPLLAVLNAIPVPAWLSGAASTVGSIPGGVAYFLGVAQVPSGLAIILGAYTIRFIIRRIPLIG